MKANLILCWTVIYFALVTNTVAFTGEETRGKPLTVAVIMDCSPNSSKPKLLTAAKSVYKSLDIGDRVMVFVVRDRKATLFASVTKTFDDHDYGDFCTIIETIKYELFARADLAKALGCPVYQQLLQRTSSASSAVVIVITEGKVSNRQAKKLCDFADYLRSEHHWPFVITGTVQGTNRQLLAASSQKRFVWRPLAEAIDPVNMRDSINQARILATGNEKVSEEEPESESVLQEIETAETWPVEPRVAVETDEAELPEDKADEVTTAPEINEPNEPVENPEELLDQPVVPLPDLVEDYNNKQEQGILAGQDANEPLQKKRHWLSRVPFLASIIFGILILSVISFLVIVAWLNARDFQKKLLSPLAYRQKSTKPRVLVVRANGVVHHIGDFRRIGTFHVGRDHNNTVTVNNKKVAPRHIRIFKRGDDLFVKNLAGTSIVVAGKELKRNKKSLLALPAIIDIADDTRIQLFWERGGNNINSKDGGPKNGITNK